MSYCVVRKAQSDTRFYEVKSKHRTKRAAQKATGRRSRKGFVMKCPAGARRGSRFSAE